MQILVTIVVGLVVGALAKLVMPGRDPGGVILTILLGVGGAVLVGAAGHALGWYRTDEGPGIIASVLGAVAVLAVYRMIAARRAW